MPVGWCPSVERKMILNAWLRHVAGGLDISSFPSSILARVSILEQPFDIPPLIVQILSTINTEPSINENWYLTSRGYTYRRLVAIFLGKACIDWNLVSGAEERNAIQGIANSPSFRQNLREPKKGIIVYFLWLLGWTTRRLGDKKDTSICGSIRWMGGKFQL